MRNAGGREYLFYCSKLQIRFETIGCRLNQIETESAARLFLDKGFSVSLASINSSAKNDFDTILCVVNTCAVTQKAEQKDRRIIRLLLEKCPNAAVLVTGCYAQLSVDEISGIDSRIAVLPGQIKSRLSNVAEILKKAVSINAEEDRNFDAVDFAQKIREEICSQPAAKIGFSEKSFLLSTDSFLIHSRSSIKIQDGCNSSCTYCTIRNARGHSVSLEADSVIERIQQLENAGQNEVVFTAVNIGQYKGAFGNSYLDFSGLLEKCLESTKKINFRISSLYPESVNDRFCEIIENPRIRAHFHLSVQSGSDKILNLMGRKYRRETIIEVCKKLRQVKVLPFISADIITGFPSESDNDFSDTVKLCQECDFAWMHIFPFSARPGTEAFSMEKQIPQAVSTRRAAELNLLAAENKAKYIESCEGKTFHAILETVKNPAIITGQSKQKIYRAVTENFLHCEIFAVQIPFKSGDEINVRITGVDVNRVKKGGEYDTTAVFAGI